MKIEHQMHQPAAEATMRSNKRGMGVVIGAAFLAAMLPQWAAAQVAPEWERVSRALARVEAAVERQEMRAGMAQLRASGAAIDASMARASIDLRRARAEAVVAQARAGRGSFAFAGALEPDADVPEPWLQEDPGGPLYQEARQALSDRRYQRAAGLFAELRSEHPRSGYVPDSYYWQAFALQRVGGNQNLRTAQELLRTQASRYPDARTRADADALLVRIEADLARRGDADAAATITQQAQTPCDQGDQDTRLAALSALLNMNAEQAVPILQEVLRSRDDCSVELRRRAVFLVAQKMTDETVDVLLDLAHRNPDPDREVREQAVFWLHQVRSPEALDALEAILEESDDADMQEKAIFSISQRSGDERAMQILRDYAQRTDAPRELRENAIFWIGQNPRAGGASYLIELYDSVQDEELKERIIFGVAQSRDQEATDWLLDRVMDESESVEVRKNALFWAGQGGGRLDMERLQELYGTLTDTEMKEQVIFVASQRRDSGAVDFLMSVAESEQDPELKERAIFWLGQSKDPRVGEFLLRLIRGG